MHQCILSFTRPSTVKNFLLAYCGSSFSDALQSGLWNGSRCLSDPYLEDLAKDLPVVILASKAPNTLSKYRLAWQQWQRWSTRFPTVSRFPAKPFEVALYLRELLNTATNIAPIHAAVYGIHWAHQAAGVSSPTDHEFVKATVEGCRRLLAKPIRPKDPLPVTVFPNLVASLGGPEATLDQLRLLVLCLVGYAGFMRISELLQVKIKQITFHDSHMSIEVPKRKNDQYRQGHVINLSRTGNPTCPVAMTRRFITKGSLSSEGHLICRLVRTKSGLVASCLGISYSRALQILKEGMKPFVGDDFNLGSHSLKSGAATVAANKGLDGHAIDKHAGWQSKKSKFRYASDSLEKKIAVSESLGL